MLLALRLRSISASDNEEYARLPRAGGPADINDLFEMETAQRAEVDLRVTPRLVDDAAWGENQAAAEFMLQPGRACSGSVPLR